jgi:hypothetical protein
LNAIVVPDFDDSFDRELVEWFARRNGVWSGSAAELLAAMQAVERTHRLRAGFRSRIRLEGTTIRKRSSPALPRQLFEPPRPSGLWQPNRLVKAWKKVWKKAPTATENVVSIEPRAKAETGEPEDSSQTSARKKVRPAN